MKIWTEKHKPSSLEEIPQIQATLITKELIKKNKPIILHGPTGSGKTTLVYTLAKELDYEILEINASDIRDKETILNIVGESAKQECLFKKEKIILIDEIDNTTSGDRGGIAAIISIIQDIKCKMILTAIEIDDEKIKQLKSKCNVVPLVKISNEKIKNILNKIFERENLIISKETIEEITTKANGDLKAAINDLQAYSLIPPEKDEIISRDKEEDIQSALKKIFRAENNIETITAIDNTPMDLDESILWLEENIPIEYKTKGEINKAFNFLSKADVFKGRIRRKQNWGYIIYQKYLMSLGINSSKLYSDKIPTRYRRNSRILKIWLHNQKYGLKKEISKKLAPYTKNSVRYIIQNFPIYKKILKKNTELIKKLKLTDEEMFFLYN